MEILERLTQLLKKQWPTAKEFRMPYCSLVEDPVTKVGTFRVEIVYKRKNDDWLETHAIAKVEPESGSITYFRDGGEWTNWV